MELKSLMNKVPGSISSVVDSANGKINDALDEYKKAMDVLQGFGLTVSNFHFKMGLPPEMSGTLHGSLADIRVDVLQQLIDTHAEDRLLMSLLNALKTAKEVQQRLNLKLSGVQIDATLGLLPSVTVALK